MSTGIELVPFSLFLAIVGMLFAARWMISSSRLFSWGPGERHQVGFRAAARLGNRSISWPFVAVVADTQSLTVVPRFGWIGGRMFDSRTFSRSDTSISVVSHFFSTELVIADGDVVIRLRCYGPHPLRLLGLTGWI